MKNKGLKTKLEFRFNIDEEVLDSDYYISLKAIKKKTKVKKINIKRNERDSSTRKLF
jgi:hypothetical protein